MQESEERPKERDEPLPARDARPPTAIEDEPRDLHGRQPIPVQARALVTYEPPRECGALTDAGRDEAALSLQILGVLAHEPAHRRVIDERLREWNGAHAPQVEKQRVEAATRTEVGVSLTTTVAEERGRSVLCDVTQAEPVGLEPAAEVSRNQQQIPGRERRVSLPQQLGPEPLDMRPERTPDLHRTRIKHARLLDGDLP
jgi:hypothetical protein